MNTRLFSGALICLLLPVVGCAASAIVDDESWAAEGDDGAESDDADESGDDDSGDAIEGIGPDDSLSVQRDAGKTVDAGRATLADAGKDAGKDAGAVSVDAGTAAVEDAGTAAVVDAGKPAVVDAGKPAVVDAGTTTPVTIPIPAGCTEKTLSSHRYAFCTAALSFNDARSACIKAGMDLTIVGDRTENDFVKANGDSWIGETYVSSKSAYRAVVPGNPQRLDGAAVTYTNWAQGDASATSRCVLLPIGCHLALSSETCIGVASNGTWDDASCSRTKGYVCESY